MKENVVSLLKTIFFFTRNPNKGWKVIEWKKIENWSEIKIIWKKTRVLKIEILKIKFKNWNLNKKKFENGNFEIWNFEKLFENESFEN